MATVGIGAALFPFEFGQRELSAFMWPADVPLATMTTLGAPSYWALLFSTAILIPAIAFATERSATRTLPVRTQPPVAVWIPITLATLLSSYCLYKLAAAGGLTMHEVWDRSVCYVEKMERRTELMRLLGNRYYAFAYSSLPIIGSFLLAKAVMRKDRVALMGFGAVSIVLV